MVPEVHAKVLFVVSRMDLTALSPQDGELHHNGDNVYT